LYNRVQHAVHKNSANPQQVKSKKVKLGYIIVRSKA